MNIAQYHRHEIFGTHNVRDLGGYETEEGRVTKSERFIRSDSLHRIQKEGIDYLIRRNLATVIDLRTKTELIDEPNPLSRVRGIKFLNLPLLDNLAPNFLGTLEIEQPSDDPLLLFYLSALHKRQFAIREIFSAMSEAAPGLILFNCTAGKDRTGIISALLLGLVKVPKIDIIRNYADSELLITELVDEFLERSRQRGGDTNSYAQMLRCPPETMATALESIVKKYSNIYTYLKHVGLSEVDLKKLSDRLVG